MPKEPIIPTDVLAHIEEAKRNGWGKNLTSWIKRHAGKLVLGLILTIGSVGIFLSVLTHPALAPSVENSAPAMKQEKSIVEKVQESISQIISPKSTPPSVSNETTQGKSFEPNSASEAITQEAQTGEGITHLARRAVSQYAQNNSLTLSPEQRVYAEDYAQKAIGSHGLAPGVKLSFPQDLLKDAVSGAQALSVAQVKNLHAYAQRVNWE